jgi:hypothetical protein
LTELLDNNRRKLSETDRLHIFLETVSNAFTRKDYLKFYKEISTATASRDLKYGVEKRLIAKFGDKKTTCYRKK